MKRRTKVALGVAACVLAAFGGLAWWQWNTLEAVVQAAQYTPEELEEKQKENKQKVQQAVAANPSITVRDLTEEEKQALRDGTLTQEELTQKLLETLTPEESKPAGDNAAENDPQTQAPSGNSAGKIPPAETGGQVSAAPGASDAPVPAAPGENQWEKDLSALVARVYILQEEYTIALDNMEDAAKEEYRGLRNRTKKAMVKFAQGYVSKALALEKECDRQMDEIIGAMETLITENSGDMTLVDTVVETYASEKSLKKAWYMAELEKRGWI
ncbi:MAG: hypothetical protein IJE22_06850 [Oscillibacter sp.]|nr:hypothetical protein [Oscillibacter sp.]